MSGNVSWRCGNASSIVSQIGYSAGIGDPYAHGCAVSAGGAALYFDDLFARKRFEAQAQLWEDFMKQSDNSGVASEIWEALRARVSSGKCGCGK